MITSDNFPVDPQAPLVKKWDGPVEFRSTGFKSGALPKADLVIDCRGIPNPYHAFGGAMRGTDPKVQAWIRHWGGIAIDGMSDLIYSALYHVYPRRKDMTDPHSRPFVVLFVCAYGVHRSVACKHILATHPDVIKMCGTVKVI